MELGFLTKNYFVRVVALETPKSVLGQKSYIRSVLTRGAVLAPQEGEGSGGSPLNYSNLDLLQE